MTKAFLIAGTALLTLSGAATAQTTGTPTGNDAATNSPAVAPDATTSENPAAAKDAMTTDSATDSTIDAPGTAAAETPSAPVPATGSAATDTAVSTTQAQPGATGTTSAAVQAEWAKYDKGNKGSLTPLEFGEWVMAANGQDLTTQVASTRTSKRANLPAVKVLNATAGAFSKADTNKDRMVSPDELTSFLNG